ncbi:uncharacterized protein TRAVEDRAFT_166217 [Trametes versicolor FP-101664 SS1]|uniref:uncharacterized protein n=1 Tax=Trametes versicolor (strain FP-101664) TaxID=717944 RepID=UPI0004623D57|nr:uncharacterized protein TRAVEDRAFT_166217 [Trametes versicolor FP-101664 SS1]EIW61093.1 hypothetical protein TRAVEDRAFT_166217 [Trametes versicolor FP-101664 SS1]
MAMNSCKGAEDGTAELTRSPEYWFDDGNIVLVAEGGVGFRVHRGVLVHHSAFFRDLFSLPQPSDDKDMMDGTPVVHVSDTPIDVAHLLRALYNGISLIRHGGERLPFPFVASLLELSHKYDIEALRADMLLRLRSCFCHKYSAFLAQTSFQPVAANDPEQLLRSGLLEIIPSRDAIRAVNLVRLVDERTMLPVALYLCTLLPGARLVSGTTLENGRVATLSPTDLALCIDARTNLVMRRIRAFNTAPASVCRQPTLCAAVLQQMARMTHYQQPSLPCHVLANVDQAPMTSPPGNFLCAQCSAPLVAVSAEFRRSAWAHLPGDLGLDVPEWDAAAA